MVIKKAPPKKKPRMIYLFPDLDRRLRVYAAEEGRPISVVVSDAVEAYLKGKRK